MKETGLPEDVAVEIVSDLASGIIDKAAESGSTAHTAEKPKFNSQAFRYDYSIVE